MFTEADRIRAIELYFKYGKKIVAVARWPSTPDQGDIRC